MVDLKEIQQTAREIGQILADNIPRGTGFALLVFDLGDGGHMTYLSNANRQDMVKALRELIGKLEGS